MTTIASLIVNVGADITGLDRGAAGVQKKLDGIAAMATKVAGVLGLAFSVTAVVSFVKELGRFAGQMRDLSDQTGIGVERLQALNYAAIGAGGSIEQVADAISIMSKNLTNGNAGANAAVERLGLNVYKLQRLEPDIAFQEIARSIAAIPNPMDQARAAMEIFGKSGAKLLPLLKSDIEGVTEEAMRNGAVISKELIEKADALDDKWNQLILRGKALVATLLGIGAAVATVATSTDKAVGGGMTFANAKAGGGTDIPDHVRLTQELQKQLDTMRQLKGPTLDTAAAFRELSAEWAIENELLEENSRQIIENIKQQAEAKAAQEKWLEVTKEMNHGLQMNLTRWAVLPPAIEDAREEIEKIRSTIVGATKDINGINTMMLATAVVPTQFMGSGNIRSADLAGKTIGQTLKGSISGALESMPQVILGALQGGGNVGKSVGSLFGGSIGTGLSNTVSKAIGGKLGNMAGSLLGPLGSIAGSLIGGGISKLFGGLFGGDSPEMKAAKKSFADLKSEAAGLGITLDKTFRLKTVKDYENAIKSLQTQMQEQQADQERLTKAIEKYGFTIEQLGPAMRKQQLHEMAKELIEDWRVLVASGIDLVLVNEKMAASVNEYLQLAIRTGTEVPMAFRPILQLMVEQGLLLDANGIAVTDLGQLQIVWAETMTQGFDRVVTKLQELIDKLVAAGTAIENIPSSIPDPFANWNVPTVPQAPEIPQLKGGGRILRTGVAVVHRGETVVPAAGGDSSGVVAAIARLERRMDRQSARLAFQIRDALATA